MLHIVLKLSTIELLNLAYAIHIIVVARRNLSCGGNFSE